MSNHHCWVHNHQNRGSGVILECCYKLADSCECHHYTRWCLWDVLVHSTKFVYEVLTITSSSVNINDEAIIAATNVWTNCIITVLCTFISSFRALVNICNNVIFNLTINFMNKAVCLLIAVGNEHVGTIVRNFGNLEIWWILKVANFNVTLTKLKLPNTIHACTWHSYVYLLLTTAW